MHSYLHTITRHQAYIEKLSLWIKIEQKDLETRTDPAPTCVRFIRKNGAVTAHFRQESQYPDRKRLIYIKGFDTTWQTAPSQM